MFCISLGNVSIYVRNNHAADAPQEPLRCSENYLFIKTCFFGEVSASLETGSFTKSSSILFKESYSNFKLTISEKIFIYLPEHRGSMTSSKHFERMY